MIAGTPPAGWTSQLLRQLATINYGKNPAPILAADGRYPVYGTSGTERRGKDYLYDGASVILGRKGSIGRVQYVTDKFWVIDTAYYLSDFNALPKWLYYVFDSIDLVGLNEATGVPSLSRDILYQIQTRVPPHPEQLGIVEVLSTIDQAIDDARKLVAKQLCIKSGLMQDLLTRGIDDDGRVRSEETHDFKQSALGTVPAEWDVVRLGDISSFVTSGARGWARYYSGDGAVFLRIGNLTRDHINLRLADYVFVRPPISAEGQRTQVKAGDLLISVTADLGIIGIIPQDFGEAYVNQHIALARLDGSTVDPRFIGWFLSSHAGQTQFEQLNESGAKAGLNLPTVRSLLVPKPSRPEQERIASIIDSSVELLEKYRAYHRKLLALKDGLKHDLLSGKSRVPQLSSQSEVTAV